MERVNIIVRVALVAMFVTGPLLLVASGTGVYLRQPASTRTCIDDWPMTVIIIGSSFLVVLVLLLLCIPCCGKDKKGKLDNSFALMVAMIVLYFIIGAMVVGIHLLVDTRTKTPPWLPSDINDTDAWKHKKLCLYHSNVCDHLRLVYANDTLPHFSSRPLSPVQARCCKPPEECHFNYSSPTNWTKPTNGNESYSNLDCMAWDNDPKKLCYNCKSCKLAVAHEAKNPRIVVGAASLAGSLMTLLPFIILWIIGRRS